MNLLCAIRSRYPFKALVLVLFTTTGCAVSVERTRVPPVVNETGTQSNDEIKTQPSTNDSGETKKPDIPVTEAPVESEKGTTWTRAGVIQTGRLREASGMAFSGNEPQVIWLVNDSGNAPELFAISTTGQSLATIKLNIRNRDWEDLSQFNFNGESFLLITDTGDNLRNQPTYKLHIVAEPVLGTRTEANTSELVSPLLSFDLILPDGSHNTEAAAVASDGYLYLITKADEPNVYRAPLVQVFNNWLNNSGSTASGDSESTLPLQGEYVGKYQRPALSASLTLIKTLTGVDLGSVTALDFDNNSGEAWVLTYRSLYRLPPAASNLWQDVLTGLPERTAGHNLTPVSYTHLTLPTNREV